MKGSRTDQAEPIRYPQKPVLRGHGKNVPLVVCACKRSSSTMFTSAQLMHDTAMTTAVVTGDVEAVKKLCRWVGKFAASPIFRHLISWLRLVPPPLKLGLFSSAHDVYIMKLNAPLLNG